MKMRTNLMIWALAFSYLAGCGSRETSAGDAVVAGNNYLSRNTQFELNGTAVRMIDMGDRWRLGYWDPEDERGNAAIVVVSKNTGRVVHFEKRTMRRNRKAP